MNTRAYHRHPGQRAAAGRGQAGFTLLELMISLTIGLFIVLALITLLINVNRNNSELSKTNRVIENGRFALQLLEADVAHAGFWAGHVPKFDDLTNTAVPNDVPTVLPDPCLALSSWDATHKNNLIGIPLQAYEIPAVVPSPTLSVCATAPTNIVTNPQPSTDVLVVRHAETCAAGVDAGCAAAVSGSVYFQEGRCTTTSSVNYTTTVSVLGTDTFTLRKRDCTTLADTYKFQSDLYYVRNYAVTVGDGIPTLMRSQFDGTTHGAAEALIEGIEGFRVEFGLDTLSDSGAAVNFGQAIVWANTSNLTSPTNRGDGLPDGAFVHCTTAVPCTASQLMNAVAVRIYVLVRSEKTTPGYTDDKTYTLGSTTLGPFNNGYKRHLFTQTVRVTNVSSRRETP
jgi:type IV pilus assembly protein PilW